MGPPREALVVRAHPVAAAGFLQPLYHKTALGVIGSGSAAHLPTTRPARNWKGGRWYEDYVSVCGTSPPDDGASVSGERADAARETRSGTSRVPFG